MIVGDLPGFAAVSIGWQDPVDVAREAIERAIARVDRGAGVLLFHRHVRRHPSNLGLTFPRSNRIEWSRA
jgi:hypothetical protein